MRFLPIAVFASIGIPVLLAGQGASPNVLAFVGANVVDVEKGVVRPHTTIVTVGDRIVYAVPDGSIRLPDGARTVRLSGAYVIPGLWDTHVHLGAGSWMNIRPDSDRARALAMRYFGALFLASGVTAVRDLGGDLATLRAADSTARAAPRELAFPRLLFTGQKLGTHPVLPGAPFPLKSPDDVARSVDLLKAAGATQVKITDLPASFTRAALVACRRVGLPCVSEEANTLSVLRDLEVGPVSYEHLIGIVEYTAPGDPTETLRREYEADHPTLTQRILYHLHLRTRPHRSPQDDAVLAHDSVRAASLFGMLARRGVSVTPTMVIMDLVARAISVDSASRGDPSLMIEPPTTAVQELHRDGADDARARRLWALDERLVREMRDAGVNILAGTDSPLQCVPGRTLYRELTLLQRAGLTPAQALRTATLNPAKYLGATDTLGTIKAGAVADLVVLAGNPLEDISHVRDIDMVVARGRLWRRPQLDSLLDIARESLAALREYPGMPSPIDLVAQRPLPDGGKRD